LSGFNHRPAHTAGFRRRFKTSCVRSALGGSEPLGALGRAGDRAGVANVLPDATRWARATVSSSYAASTIFRAR